MLLHTGKDFTIHSLSGEEYFKNEQYYLDSFDEIDESQNLPLFSRSRIEREYFRRFPINSFLYIKSKNKIVAYCYNTPKMYYPCYDEYNSGNLDNWGNNYVKVHKDFCGKGYAYLLILACLDDVKKKGGKMIEYMPIRKSCSIIHHVVTDNNIGKITAGEDMFASGILTVEFNQEFLNSKKNLLDDENTYVRHKHETLKSYDSYFDYYFNNDEDYIEDSDL